MITNREIGEVIECWAAEQFHLTRMPPNHPHHDAVDDQKRTWQIKGREMFPKGRSFDFSLEPNCDFLLAVFYVLVCGAPKPITAYLFPRDVVERELRRGRKAKFRWQKESRVKYSKYRCFSGPEADLPPEVQAGEF